MVVLIRSLFESALKTNDTLEFAVVTGCLRISKESYQLQQHCAHTRGAGGPFGKAGDRSPDRGKDHHQADPQGYHLRRHGFHPGQSLEFPVLHRLSEEDLEIKVVRTYQELESKCDEALRQIDEQKYEEALRQEGYSDILKYGIAFYRKECMVK